MKALKVVFDIVVGVIQHARLVTVLLLMIPSSVLARELDSQILASIEPIKTKYYSSDELEVRVSYTNVGSQDIRFLKRGTALDSIIGDEFLSLSLDGQKIPYIGIFVKRLPPVDRDFVVIQPGQKVSAVIDLSLSYAINVEGHYQVLYKDRDIDLKEPSLGLANGAVLNVIEDRPIRLFRRTPIIASSCDAAQRDQINQALTIAETIGVQASQDLNNAPVDQRPSAQRYREWFGVYTASRYERVRRGMESIANALVNNPIGFDCTCDIDNRESVFAFVFANDPFNMNVCPVFFRVRPSGTDSRSGTIIHEISHFTVTAGTTDFRNNQAGVRDLALSQPDNAVRAANAYEYFAENTPFLSMPGPVDPVDADLVLSSVVISTVDPETTELVEISGAVVNQGGSVSLSTILRLTLSAPSLSTQVTEVVIPPIVQGESANFEFEFEAPSEPGEYLTELCVLVVEGESNTTNNCSVLSPLIVGRTVLVVPPILELLLED